MNNRLKELAQQANIFEYTKYFDPTPHTSINNQDAVQKFAELIISETVSYLNSEIDRLCEYRNNIIGSERDKKADVDLAIEKCEDNIQGIRDHFGVKS